MGSGRHKRQKPSPMSLAGLARGLWILKPGRPGLVHLQLTVMVSREGQGLLLRWLPNSALVS